MKLILATKFVNIPEGGTCTRSGRVGRAEAGREWVGGSAAWSKEGEARRGEEEEEEAAAAADADASVSRRAFACEMRVKWSRQQGGSARGCYGDRGVLLAYEKSVDIIVLRRVLGCVGVSLPACIYMHRVVRVFTLADCQAFLQSVFLLYVPFSLDACGMSYTLTNPSTHTHPPSLPSLPPSLPLLQ